MTNLVRVWGQVAMVSPGTSRKLIDTREVPTIEAAKSLAEELRLAVVNRKISWPVNIGVSHIDFGFPNEQEAKTYKPGPRNVFPMGDGTFSTVEHHF